MHLDSNDSYIQEILSGILLVDIEVIGIDFTKSLLGGGFEFYILRLKTKVFDIKLTNHSFILEVENNNYLNCYDIFSIIYGLGYSKQEVDVLMNSFISTVEDFSGKTLNEITYGIW